LICLASKILSKLNKGIEKDSPNNRMTVIERFTFNLEDRQLYIYDVIGDKLIHIKFDRGLLLKFDEFCK